MFAHNIDGYDTDRNGQNLQGYDVNGQNLHGFGQDLTDSTFDTIDTSGSFDVSAGTPDLTAGVLNPDTSALAASTQIPTVQDTASASGGSGSLLSSLLTGLGVGAAAGLTTVAQGYISTATLQATNAQRMSQGLPPLNANGTVMTAAQMLAAGYSQAQVSTFQSQLSGNPTTFLIIGAIAIGALLLLSSKKA